MLNKKVITVSEGFFIASKLARVIKLYQGIDPEQKLNGNVVAKAKELSEKIKKSIKGEGSYNKPYFSNLTREDAETFYLKLQIVSEFSSHDWIYGWNSRLIRVNPIGLGTQEKPFLNDNFYFAKDLETFHRRLALLAFNLNRDVFGKYNGKIYGYLLKKKEIKVAMISQSQKPQ